MSLVLNTVRSFPRGRTTEELLVLVGASFSHDKRLATFAELEQLMQDGLVVKARDGRWRAKRSSLPNGAHGVSANDTMDMAAQPDTLQAAPANFYKEAALGERPDTDIIEMEAPDPQALLRYWRSALRSDPRGATTQVLDKHGVEWALIAGRGPVKPEDGERLKISIELAALDPSFQEALVRREGYENVLAVGWPMAVGRQAGVPIFQPVGMLVASWVREGETLVLSVDGSDVLVNPDWVNNAARRSGWTQRDLADLFHATDGIGLSASDFLDKVRVAVASQVRGRISGEDLASQLDSSAPGIYDSAAIFLPTDSSFTAGAARDLDAIAAWPHERLCRTALGAVIGLETDCDFAPVPAISAAPLNKEQLRAVQGACEAPLTVVTGPPGTGKSQAIVSMAASVLAAGGSVLVASKNHQALDAVEDRLGALAAGIPFLVRTLNPKDEADNSFSDVLKHLLANENGARASAIDEVAMSDLAELATQLQQAVAANDRIAELECEIADILDRIELREARGRLESSDEASVVVPSRFVRLFRWLRSLLFSKTDKEATSLYSAERLGMSKNELHRLLSDLRAAKEKIGTPGDPIELGERLRDVALHLLPRLLSVRTQISEQQRHILAELSDDWQFSGGKGLPPTDLAQALLSYRPLWLASILGTPRRIPLDDGLFDLVIFDEASQCDIATAIPLFARAKRAVVVGDDQQLSFIPQLGQSQDRNLMQAQGLPVPKMGRFAQSRSSLFDFASRTPGVERITLRHQYRSAGPIVDYVNNNFYGGQLQVSYDPQGLVIPKGAKPGLVWEHVPAPSISQVGNVNPAEIAAIVKHIDKLLNHEGYEGTIGVITPFRAQVAALEAAICQSIDKPKRIACELKVGTVDSFQGQERDLVMFSPCIGPRSPQSGRTFFKKDTRRLNVAISRARAVAMVFGDLEFARSNQSGPLRRLAAMATEPRPSGGEGVFDSAWERKVFHALKARGLEPQPQFEIAGRRLDFALFGANGVKLDLEVDGRKWHQSQDGRRKTSDLWRDHQLKSLGWRVRRFWVDELAKDMEGCLDRVEQDLS